MRRSGRIAFGCPSYHVTMGDTKMPDIILFDIILVEEKRKMFASCTWLGMRQAPIKLSFRCASFVFGGSFT